MIASKVLQEKELKDTLQGLGYSPTDRATKTSIIWQNTGTGSAIQVPHSIDGFYPDWLLSRLEKILSVKFPRH